jgi:hypothetical protein
MKAPSTNIQAPEKLQIPSSKTKLERKQRLDFGAWCFSEAWMLVLGASTPLRETVSG